MDGLIEVSCRMTIESNIIKSICNKFSMLFGMMDAMSKGILPGRSLTILNGIMDTRMCKIWSKIQLIILSGRMMNQREFCCFTFQIEIRIILSQHDLFPKRTYCKKISVFHERSYYNAHNPEYLLSLVEFVQLIIFAKYSN